MHVNERECSDVPPGIGALSLMARVQLKSRKVRGFTSPYAIKLFYTSNIPIILQTADAIGGRALVFEIRCRHQSRML